jgi:GntR family transcriptional regulator
MRKSASQERRLKPSQAMNQTTKPAAASSDGENTFGFRPLYQQVRERLVARLIDGTWPPGLLLPSEQQLAAELGVSQGTVRKALDAIAADNLLIRRQGRGTFVAEPEEGRILFQFFRLTADDGRRRFPQSRLLSVTQGKATGVERRRLALESGATVWRVRRVRELDDTPMLIEKIVLPAARFPDLGALQKIPNNVYALYASAYGVTIARAEEKLKAVAATTEDARRLNCPPNTPLLFIDRVAFSIDEIPAEWRVSRCLSDGYHYLSDLK